MNCYKHMAKIIELFTHKICELKHNRKKTGKDFIKKRYCWLHSIVDVPGATELYT